MTGNDTHRSYQLRGMLTPSHDPTASEAIRRLQVRQEARRPLPPDRYTVDTTAQPWMATGVRPETVEQADVWLDALNAEREAMKALALPGSPPPAWVIERLRHVKAQLREINIARCQIVDPAYQGNVRPLPAKAKRQRQVAEIIGEEPTDRALLVALGIACREIFEAIEASGVSIKPFLTADHRTLLGFVSRYIKDDD
jgi:hypothetical protein